jgi:glycine/D-amino acid oxidase-like deaminating enzyme
VDQALSGLPVADAGFRGTSFWFDSLAGSGVDSLAPRAPLAGDRDVDVAIIGGGLTGLWSAYYLLQENPALRIAILEKHIAGFGASGRNGGWCSALFPASSESLERQHGRAAAIAMRATMVATVSEVGRVAEREGIDCDFLQGGTIALALSGVQLAAARAEVTQARDFGIDLLELRDVEHSPRASAVLGSSFDPACARLHPAKLVRGLASVLEARGVSIFEQTEVLSFRPHQVVTSHGVVTAESIVVATEGYGATFREDKKRTLPLYSLMIATEPLAESVWEEIGIPQGATFTDYRHLLIYGQRTADNRFAFGGRGARYHWGSSVNPAYENVPRVFSRLEKTLFEMFPQAAKAQVTHRWGGPLGVPRDWHASASYDSRTGIARAGGYVGDGLSTTNLAGRTLAHLITGRSSELTALPWVNHRSPAWEPEPLRFIGANLGLLAMGIADQEERITKRPSVVARLMGPLTGH